MIGSPVVESVVVVSSVSSVSSVSLVSLLPVSPLVVPVSVPDSPALDSPALASPALDSTEDASSVEPPSDLSQADASASATRVGT
jgi:hypothetical protein